MKFVSFRYRGGRAVGVVDDAEGSIAPLDSSLGTAATDIVELVRNYQVGSGPPPMASERLRLSDVDLEPSVPRPPRNIFCVGKNYREHAQEFAQSGYDKSADAGSEAVPVAPIIFTKAPETVIAHGQSIRYPSGVSEQLDYEAELAVVIGRGGRGISRAQAYSHVWGYTIVNDVTARDLQAKHKQWFLGKSLDTFCPIGPWLVTADEINPTRLHVRCWVNGELRQDANTADLIFDIPALIETISAGITLLPGDVIATGTPAGVGIGFDPPRFLQPGDRIDIDIEGIGRLGNSVE